MVTAKGMAGPTVEDLEIGKDVTRVWPQRWSINRKGLEAILHCVRRKDTDELDRLWRKIVGAFELQGPDY